MRRKSAGVVHDQLFPVCRPYFDAVLEPENGSCTCWQAGRHARWSCKRSLSSQPVCLASSPLLIFPFLCLSHSQSSCAHMLSVPLSQLLNYTFVSDGTLLPYFFKIVKSISGEVHVFSPLLLESAFRQRFCPASQIKCDTTVYILVCLQMLARHAHCLKVFMVSFTQFFQGLNKTAFNVSSTH